MTKNEVLQFMLKSINDDNLEFCKMAQLPEEEIQKQFTQSQPSLQVIVLNLYDRMKEAKIID
jgi:hypothetical protein